MRNWNDVSCDEVFNAMMDSALDEVDKMVKDGVYKFGPDRKTCKDIGIPFANLNLIFTRGNRYLVREFNRYKKLGYDKRQLKNEMFNEIEREGGIISNYTPACTNTTFFEIKDTHLCCAPETAIYINTDQIVSKLLKWKDNNDVYNQLILILKHELGHAVDFLSFCGKPYSEVIAELDRRDKIEKGIKRRINKLRDSEDPKDNKEYIRAYNEELPAEIMANKCAKFTDDEYKRYLKYAMSYD